MIVDKKKNEYHCQKTFLFQVIQLVKQFLSQTIQFSISIDFCLHTDVRTVLFQTIEFSVSTVSMSKNHSISNNSVYHTKTIPFQTIQFSVSTVSMSKTIQFQTIQFTIQKQFHFK